MANLILQPASDGASKANLLKTVFQEVHLADIHGFLRPSDRQALDLLSDSGSVSFWGAKPAEDGRNIKRWDRVAPGDTILFALGKQRALLARVTYKLHNRQLSEDLWGSTQTANGQSQTWEYMFAVDSLQERHYDKATLNRIIERKENADIREFMVLRPEQSEAALSYFEVPASAASPARPAEARAPLRKRLSDKDVSVLDVLDATVTSRRRLEQRLLREYLLAEDTGTCALCERPFPIQFLVAAHIKPRSRCTDKEKRDIENIAMPNCKFGCDELFERGYIAVDSTGHILTSSKAPETGPVRAYIREHLVDRASLLWQSNTLTRGYFAFHADQTFKV